MPAVDPVVIHTQSAEAVGVPFLGIGQAGSGSNPLNAANDAWYIPFVLNEPFTVSKVGWHNGATASGNVDFGIYSENGTRLYSSGSTAQSGTNVVQTVTPTAFTLPPGRYYMALAADGTTGTFRTFTLQESGRATGVFTQATAFTLPSTATFAAPSATKFRCPWIFISRRTTV